MQKIFNFYATGGKKEGKMGMLKVNFPNVIPWFIIQPERRKSKHLQLNFKLQDTCENVYPYTIVHAPIDRYGDNTVSRETRDNCSRSSRCSSLKATSVCRDKKNPLQKRNARRSFTLPSTDLI